ncbi:MAG: InlB B-repeat-containing protein [Bacteroidaceae bacterium]|nr:InlB B-repeat-containing protein [Bacteroidaceae bacterium]
MNTFTKVFLPKLAVAVLALAGLASSVGAEVRFSIADVILAPGESKTVEILMDNDESGITDLQFDLVVPDNVTLDPATAALTARASSDQTLQVVQQSGGAYRFLIISATKNGFSGTTGAIATITATASSEVGEGTITFSGMKAVTGEATVASSAAESADAIVETPFTGVAFTSPVTELTLTSGDEAQIAINLRNSMPIASMQATVTLPAGLEFATDASGSFITTTDRVPAGAGFSAICRTDNGRFLLSSTTNTPFADERGTLLYINVRATSAVQTTSTITISDFTASTPAAQSIPTTDAISVTVTGNAVPLPTYTVTATADPAVGGTVSGAGTFDEGSSVTLTATAAAGYTLRGWYVGDEQVSTAQSYTFTLTADVAVTARFAENPADTYTLTFVIDGTTILQQALAEGDAITAPEAPEREGYTFAGWTPAVAATMPAADVTYTGTYTVNQYVVTFVIDGTIAQQTTQNFGTAISAPAVEEREGYYFSGWQPAVATTVPARDVTYNGYYVETGKYTVTFIDGDQVILTYTADAGDEVGVPAVPEKEGHTFTGWTPAVPATMPANSLTFHATYAVNTYLVSYYVGQQLWAEDEVAYGSPVVLREYVGDDPRYTFIEWEGERYATMPAHNLEYRAKLADGITAATAVPAAATEVYSLDGRRVAAKDLRPGIYIVGSRKVKVD